MAATLMAVPSLAPRPTPVPIAAWKSPTASLAIKENRPALKQLQQSAPAARARKERPCDGCRKRKSKCVLQENRRCVLCEFHKQDCTFVEKAQPRKRKVEDTTSNIEHGLAKKVLTSANHASTLRSQPSTPASQTTSILSTSILSTSAMHKPFAVDESLSLQRHRHCKFVGHTTGLDASLINLSNFDGRNETASDIGTLRKVTGDEYFSTHADAEIMLPEDEARALAEIDQVVGPHGPALIEIYFRNVHPSYPILQKQAFLDRHRHGDRQFNPPLLAAMYLLALNWWNRDPDLAQLTRPDATQLERIAIASLNVAMQRPKISAVQAGLLLLQRARSSTWTLAVQLVALGQDIGLHLDCSNWTIPLWEQRLRKRLAWALYMQDKWSALMHGRPSHINNADWAVPQPTIEDFDEALPSSSTLDENAIDFESVQGRTTFMQMIALTEILSDICETFYSQKAQAETQRAGQYATQLVLNRAKPVQLRLKEWFAKLPAECKMDHDVSTGALPPTGYLHLGYFAAEISIHRRIVKSLDPSTADPYMLYICRSAAKTRLISAMDFVNRLRPEHLDAFWYFASASNFSLIATFGAILQMTSPGREEAAFYAARLNEYRWTLSMCAKKATWIEGAIDMLVTNADMLHHLPEKPPADAKPPPAPPRAVLPPPPPVLAKSFFDDQSVFSGLDNGSASGDENLDLELEAEMEMDGWSGV